MLNSCLKEVQDSKISIKKVRFRAGYNYRQKNQEEKVDECGTDNCKVYWIEDYPYNSKKELEARKGYDIQNMEYINQIVAERTRIE